MYIEDGSSSSDSETISEPQAVKKRKIISNDKPQTKWSESQTQSKKYCTKCNAAMKKKNHYYCPNKCKLFLNLFEQILDI